MSPGDYAAPFWPPEPIAPVIVADPEARSAQQCERRLGQIMMGGGLCRCVPEALPVQRLEQERPKLCLAATTVIDREWGYEGVVDRGDSSTGGMCQPGTGSALAERRQRIGYEWDLIATADACRNIQAGW